MHSIRVSIIIAAYNVEKYIERCIYSLLNQTYNDIEIIVVNDCSTDATASICEKFAKADHRLILVNKLKNEGLSEARNTGISEASGEYITFVDGDDFIEPDTIEKCVNEIMRTNPDEIVFGSFFDRNNGMIQEMKMIHALDFYKGDNLKQYYNEAIGSLPDEINDRNIGITPWGRVYRKEILDEHCLRFISERVYIYEDLVFFLLSTPHISSVAVLDAPLYHYCENEGSLTQKNDLNRFKKVKAMYEYIKNTYRKSLFLNDETLLRFKRLMLSYIRLSVMQMINGKNSIKLIRATCNDGFTKEILEGYPINKLPFKQKMFAYLLKFKFSFLLYCICKLYNICQL